MGKMRVVWIVNVVFPEICSVLGLEKTVIGGWLFAYKKALKESFSELELHIISPYKGRNIRKIESGGDVFYVFPENIEKEKLLLFYKKINAEVSPLLVHIHGTEFFHSYAYVEANGNDNVLVSIQGMVSVYARYYYGGIEHSDLRKYVSLRDILKGETIRKKRDLFVKNGKTETELIRKVKYIAGRTSWDYSNCWILNKSMNFFVLNEPLRSSFYENQWKIENCRRHSIFMSQTYYPIKGLHKMLEALPAILDVYPDTELFLCGENITDKPWYRRTTYGNYIKSLIEKYRLDDHVHFVGVMNEAQMVSHYLSANVFVCPSSIENSSNSVCEAQLLGTPVVSAYVGGLMDLVEDGRTGLLYRFEEVPMLANKICRIFENDDLAANISLNERKVALKRHDRMDIARELMSIYNSIINRNI